MYFTAQKLGYQSNQHHPYDKFYFEIDEIESEGKDLFSKEEVDGLVNQIVLGLGEMVKLDWVASNTRPGLF